MLKRFDLNQIGVVYIPIRGFPFLSISNFRRSKCIIRMIVSSPWSLPLNILSVILTGKRGERRSGVVAFFVICYISAEDLCCAYGNVLYRLILIILFCLLLSEHFLACGVSGFSCSITFYRGRSKFCCPVGFLSSYIF